MSTALPPRDPVPRARSEDISRRAKLYMIQMALRFVFLGLIFVVPGWWKLVMLAAALILPYFAVMAANDQDHSAEYTEAYTDRPAELPALEATVHRPPTMYVDENGTVHIQPDEDHPVPDDPVGPAPPGSTPRDKPVDQPPVWDADLDDDPHGPEDDTR
ncbi:MAG: DUF3099 domain-containing protein [Brachybacterium sp.]|nr:DUF3099 domain-containing protein [Brachybacterium sp.]